MIVPFNDIQRCECISAVGCTDRREADHIVPIHRGDMMFRLQVNITNDVHRYQSDACIRLSSRCQTFSESVSYWIFILLTILATHAHRNALYVVYWIVACDLLDHCILLRNLCNLFARSNEKFGSTSLPDCMVALKAAASGLRSSHQSCLQDQVPRECYVPSFVCGIRVVASEEHTGANKTSMYCFS